MLSGFLITQILLKNPNEGAGLAPDKKRVLKNFYIRRVLRIFPIYYLTIVLTVLLRHKLNYSITGGELLASATYTTNFYLYKIESWTDATPHFWSLAVEEQFYLLWPLLMLFLPTRFLLHCIVGFILIGVFSQSLVSGSWFGYALPHTCFDPLGMGSLLAWLIAYKKEMLLKFYKAASFLALLGLCVVILSFIYDFEAKQERFFHSWIGLWIITYIILNQKKRTFLITLLSNERLILIGKMSYGIYLYHVLYLYFGLKLWDKYFYDRLKFLGDANQTWLFLGVNILPFLLICWFSFRFIETPILRLKNKFNYQDKKLIPLTSKPNKEFHSY